ncbi:unnamed protein product, partial [Ixodes persulcatus]
RPCLLGGIGWIQSTHTVLRGVLASRAPRASEPLLTQDAPEEFHGQREHDGRVLLGGDGRERLQVAQLEGRAGLGDDVGSILERTGRALLAFRRNHLFPHLGASFSGRLGFGCHGPLHLNRQANNPGILVLVRHSHFNTLHLHSPGVCGFVQVPYLHGMADGLSLGQDLGEVLCAQHVPERRGRQEPRGAAVVLDVGHGHRGVLDAVVDDRVHGHSYGVLGQDL